MNEYVTTPQHEKQIGYWVSFLIYLHVTIFEKYCYNAACIVILFDYVFKQYFEVLKIYNFYIILNGNI